MRILLGHGFPEKPAFGKQWIEHWLERLRAASVDIHGTEIGLPVRDARLPWKELDRRWRRGDRQLMQLYERLGEKLSSYDVFINYGGLSLHPEFIRQLNTLNVFGFFDDPESSAEISRPLAPAYDICAIGNVAELDTYRSWGVKNVFWWPLGFRFDDYDPDLSSDDILSRKRSVDVTLLCERVTHHRRAKVDQFALAFPQGVYRGHGWPGGFLAEEERVPLLQRTKVGVNIHNSTGPINFRTFYLPANGVLQICDNRSHLGEVFEVGTEVIGYDTIGEAIEYCRYYLAHEDERRRIAAAGFRRTLRDYNEVAAFHHVTRAISDLPVEPAGRRVAEPEALALFITHRRQSTRFRRTVHAIFSPVTVPLRNLHRYTVGSLRRSLRLGHNIAYWIRSRRLSGR